jgi:hypothetical protein
MPSSGTPVGTVTSFAGNVSLPAVVAALTHEGWLLCDGASYSTSEYPQLQAVVLSAHGGDATHFNVPNLRGRWIRGTNYTAGTGSSTVDPDTLTRTPAAPGGRRRKRGRVLAAGRDRSAEYALDRAKCGRP